VCLVGKGNTLIVVRHQKTLKVGSGVLIDSVGKYGRPGEQRQPNDLFPVHLDRSISRGMVIFYKSKIPSALGLCGIREQRPRKQKPFPEVFFSLTLEFDPRQTIRLSPFIFCR
jgi:hypothetical protein